MLDRLMQLVTRDEEGQGLAEYALILALIAIVAIIALIFLGGQVSQILSTVGSSDLAPHPRALTKAPARPDAGRAPSRFRGLACRLRATPRCRASLGPST